MRFGLGISIPLQKLKFFVQLLYIVVTALASANRAIYCSFCSNGWYLLNNRRCIIGCFIVKNNNIEIGVTLL